MFFFFMNFFFFIKNSFGIKKYDIDGLLLKISFFFNMRGYILKLRGFLGLFIRKLSNILVIRTKVTIRLLIISQANSRLTNDLFIIRALNFKSLAENRLLVIMHH